MLEINLRNNQVPTQLDLPRKRKTPRRVVLLFILGGLLFVLASAAGVYYFFKSTINKKLEEITGKEKLTPKPKKIEVKITKREQTKKAHIEIRSKKKQPKTTESKKVLSAVSEVSPRSGSRKIETGKKPPKKEKSKVKEVKNVSQPEESLKISKKSEGTYGEVKGENHTVNHTKKAPSGAVKPVFVVDVELSNIPEPVKKSAPLKLNIPFVDNVTKKAEKPGIKKKIQKTKSERELTVAVKTLRAGRLRSFLKKHGIRYSCRRKLFEKYVTYRIFVGGFDSYPYVAKFAMDLKRKGYSIYSIVNINLLFYVCIDKGVSRKVKDRYIEVWSKTPFKIIAKPEEHRVYGYLCRFRIGDKKIINMLKKMGYYPIIIREANGA